MDTTTAVVVCVFAVLTVLLVARVVELVTRAVADVRIAASTGVDPRPQRELASAVARRGGQMDLKHTGAGRVDKVTPSGSPSGGSKD